MDRAELDRRNTAAIRRHYRDLTDTGQPPQQLLDDLAATAGEHADDIPAARANPAIAAGIVLPPSEMISAGTERASAPAKAAPARTTARRTTARRTAK